ncbi:ATP-binding protein [Actinokineospora guangxiensis]|uniref:ATP-binding protein n=1 Tax=Actinokineospora guangxiensis TaxID=1490288 RepID=A0ABW0ES32_9PSEU
MTSLPTHRAIAVFDVEGFSADYRDDRARLAVRAAMYRMVETAFTTSGVPWGICFRENVGDGVIVVVPPTVSKVPLLDPLPDRLAADLAEHNRHARAAERLRMRMVVHAGEVTEDDNGFSGAALVHACRIIDAAGLRTALAGADGPLALAVSDPVYEGIVRQGYRGISAADYHPLRVESKNGRLHAWLRLPGSSHSPAPAPTAPDVARPEPPRQLVPAPAALVGRDAELAALDAAAAAHRLLVVTGPPGVGKSALALRWAHGRADGRPDGQLYADLGGQRDPVPPEEVLGRFLRALGVPAGAVPLELDELSARFRSITADLDLLVVLDNAASAAQVRALVPGSPRALTVVTSRRSLGALAVDGARVVEVGPLPVEAAVDLLAALAGDGRVRAAPEHAARLAQLCSGLPIALCVVGARLAGRPKATLARAVDDLVDERRRLARLSFDRDLSVEVVFDVSYHALSEPAAKLYRTLGLHPGPQFAVEAAAAAIGVAGADAEPLLEELAGAHLVEEPEPGRCGLHELIRLHARQQAEAVDSERDRSVAVRRFTDWYLSTAVSASAQVTPHRDDLRCDLEYAPVEATGFTGHGDGLAWLERERTNLLAVARQAMERGWPAAAWQIADAMWGLFLFRSHYRDWLEFDLLAVEATRRAGDAAAEAKAADRLGLLHHALGRNTEALVHMRRAQALWHSLGDAHRCAQSIERLGFAHLDLGEVDVALRHFRDALAEYRRLGQDRSTGLALISLGRALLDADRPAEAAEALAEATAVFDGLDVADPYNRARAQIALGRAETRTGDITGARARLSDAERTMTALDSPLGGADAAWALGELEQEHGDRASALAHYRRTEAVFAALGNPGLERVQARIRSL